MKSVRPLPRLALEAVDFQDEIGRLMAEPAPLALRLWPLLGALALATLVFCASQLRLDIVVVATGRLATDTPQVILQPLVRATLRDLLVKPGDVVVAGQLLARLDATLPEADRAALAAEEAALAAENARLEAELAGVSLLADSPDGVFQQQVQQQRADLAAARRGILSSRIEGLLAGDSAERAAGAGLRQRLSIALEVEAMRQELADRQSGSRLAVLEAEAQRLNAQAGIEAHAARLADLAERLATARADLSAFDLDLRRSIMEALVQNRLHLSQRRDQLAKANLMASKTELVAPRPGVVLSVSRGGPGSVVGEGEAVVVLVPTDVPLIAEIGIKSAELGAIAVGDAVSLKIDAFPWRKHGVLSGRLTDVSRASFTPEGTISALHSGHVSLQGSLANLPPGALLLPGMTLSAEIQTGTRTILDYFTDPLMRGLNESLREP